MSNEGEVALLQRRVDILEQKLEAKSSLLTWIIISLMIIRLFSYILYIPKMDFWGGLISLEVLTWTVLIVLLLMGHGPVFWSGAGAKASVKTERMSRSRTREDK